MKPLCLLVGLLHASLQLRCDKKDIKVHIGEEFVIGCEFDTSRYLFSKKYWCRGDTRSSCEILVDSEGVAKTTYARRSRVIDGRKRGLFVKVTNLQYDDSGVYWVGIDKIYSDIMTSVSVLVTEVPVSKPRVQALGSPADRSTCWGKPVTVGCICEKGTDVEYSWHRRDEQNVIVLQRSSNLNLGCDSVERNGNYFCKARNGISDQDSDVITVQVLSSADGDCVYVIKIPGQPVYDCADRMSTTTTTTRRTTEERTTSQQFLISNQTQENVCFRRTWTGMPFWYTLFRWALVTTLLFILCTVQKCTKTSRKRFNLSERQVKISQT